MRCKLKRILSKLMGFVFGLVIGGTAMWYWGWMNSQPAFYTVHDAGFIELNSRLDVPLGMIKFDIAHEMGEMVVKEDGRRSMPSMEQGSFSTKDQDGNVQFTKGYTRFADAEGVSYEIINYSVPGKPWLVVLDCSDQQKKYDLSNAFLRHLAKHQSKGGW